MRYSVKLKTFYISFLVFVFSCITTHEKELMINKGVSWAIKTHEKVHGPGNNQWAMEHSDDEEPIVFRISNNDSTPICSEIFSTKKDFGFGIYTLHFVGNLNSIQDNTVLGIFLYECKKEKPLEVDIEFTKWNDETGPNLHYTLHNFKEIPSKPQSKSFKLNGDYFTCIIKWDESGLYLGAFHGHIMYESQLLNSMTKFKLNRSDQRNNFRMHINYWKMGNTYPRSETEKISLKQFLFKP